VLSITAPASVPVGQIANNIDVQVKNEGTEPETTDVSVTSDASSGTISGLQNISLNPGQETTLSFVWRTIGASLGDHTLIAEVAVVTGEIDTLDNIQSTVSTVVEDQPVNIVLTATGYKVKGKQKADLEWTGASSSTVDIFRDGELIATQNDGDYTDHIDNKGGGSYQYQVCEQGSSSCSSIVTVTF
jgi:hypothetical protein